MPDLFISVIINQDLACFSFKALSSIYNITNYCIIQSAQTARANMVGIFIMQIFDINEYWQIQFFILVRK